jgi:hypothetical protein
MPGRRKLPRKTADDDAEALDELSDFMELIKAKIASHKIKEILENMELTEFNHLHAYIHALYQKRNNAANEKRDSLRRVRRSGATRK